MSHLETMSVIVGAAEYYKVPLSKTQLNIYIQSLSPYSSNSIEQALMEHINDPNQGRFMPLVAHLLRRLNASYYDKAENAWNELMSSLETMGAKGIPTFNAEHTRSVIVKIGGWRNLCTLSYERLGKLKGTFNDLYIVQAKLSNEEKAALQGSQPFALETKQK